MAVQRFYRRAFGLLLLSWPLGGGGSSAGLSREAFRHILANRLYSDLACDKLDRRTTEPGHGQAVGLKE